MSRGHRVVALVFVLLLMAFSALAQPVIKVGSIPTTSQMPLQAALNQGYFDQEGMKLSLEMVAGGAEAIPALVGGSLNFSQSAYISVFVARDKGFDIAVVAPYDRVAPNREGGAIVVRTDSGINTPRDLAGKALALNVIKSLNWLYAVEWVSRHGLAPEKISWLEMPFPAMIGAVRTKKVDAAFAVEPFLTVELAQGGLKVLSRPFSEVDPEMPISGVIGKESWLKGNQGAVVRLARALRKGTDWVNQNKDKWGELLASYTRIKSEWVPKMTFPLHEYPVSLPRLQATADLSLKWGLIGKRLEAREAVWPTALER